MPISSSKQVIHDLEGHQEVRVTAVDVKPQELDAYIQGVQQDLQRRYKGYYFTVVCDQECFYPNAEGQEVCTASLRVIKESADQYFIRRHVREQFKDQLKAFRNTHYTQIRIDEQAIPRGFTDSVENREYAALMVREYCTTIQRPNTTVKVSYDSAVEDPDIVTVTAHRTLAADTPEFGFTSEEIEQWERKGQLEVVIDTETLLEASGLSEDDYADLQFLKQRNQLTDAQNQVQPSGKIIRHVLTSMRHTLLRYCSDAERVNETFLPPRHQGAEYWYGVRVKFYKQSLR